MRMEKAGKLGAAAALIVSVIAATCVALGRGSSSWALIAIAIDAATAAFSGVVLAVVGATLAGMLRGSAPSPTRPFAVFSVELDNLDRKLREDIAAWRERDAVSQAAELSELAARQTRDTQQEVEKASADERARRLEVLTKSFESKVGRLVQTLSLVAVEMTDTAQNMFGAADHSNKLARNVATASADASANVSTVAAAAEELSVSIQEIARQISASSRIAEKAVQEMARADVVLQGLEANALKIGEVVDIIRSIASQTKILGLNATIEASRAGAAGKGFAVISNEVKTLANRTEIATHDVNAQILEVQAAIKEAVTAIRNVATTIVDISATSATIAAAVEQQETATQEITRGVHMAAQHTEDVSHTIVGVTAAAANTGEAADQVLGIAKRVAGRANELGGEVNAFLAEVGLLSALRKRKAISVSAANAHVWTNTGPATAEVNNTGLAVDDNTVKIGILHSETGTMALSESGPIQAELLAIKQINERGGVLGRQIEVVKEDGASDDATFTKMAEKLLAIDKVAAVFGCCTSSSRKALLPVLERHNGLLYYPSFYEGLEQSKNVIYTGQEATQQILVGLDWLMKEKGARSFFLVGSDYVWPRVSNKIARRRLENAGCRVVGEEYVELGQTQFESIIVRIKAAKPDVIYALVVGGSAIAFYKQLRLANIDLNTQTVMTNAVTEDEITGIGADIVAGGYACMKYFQSLESPSNSAFVEAYKEVWGAESVIGDGTHNAYLGPWLWKLAVEKAGSFDVSKVTAASPGVEFPDAPAGYIRIHENHHLWSKTRVGHA
ncbi:MAG: hypothetical protein E7774_07085, partial [Bradyrhizobium sp.]